MDLEQPQDEFKPIADKRFRMEEPPPVWLVTVEDARLPMAAGLEAEVVDFYVKLLQFEQDEAALPRLVFRAENFAILFDVIEPPIERDDMRMLGIAVPGLRELEKQLIEREIEYAWEKGLVPGQEAIQLVDPAGNWLSITEHRIIS